MRFWKSSPEPWANARRQASRAAIGVMLGAAGGAGIACREQAPSAPATYQSFYAVPAASPAEARGTLKGDYQWAARSTTPQEATARWREFLKSHQPADGEYEDAFQRNYVRSAQYELMRAEYLLGHAGAGDVLLRELEDVRGKQ